ncbi:MAG: hypothetical protein CMI32_01505 [Opitutales bacterium]|jgi:hypothetical protein|nr:hypothetical protein [Opitutales bacterium]
MKKHQFIVSILLSLALFPAGLFAWGKDSRKDKRNTAGYLEQSLPQTLVFDVDPLPADRLMLVTKAPKALPSVPLVLPIAADSNKTVTSATPVATIDPPPRVPHPTLSVPAPATIISNPTTLRPSPMVVPPVVVTTDDILDLLELETKSPSKAKPTIIVPFELPFSQTPSSGVLSSEARYIKRWK